MPTFILVLFRFARLLFSGHAAVAVENAALRLQLAAFQRKRTTRSDFPRPPILGRTLPAVEALALSPDLRPGRYRRPLAARAISRVLGTSFQKEPTCASRWDVAPRRLAGTRRLG